MMCGQRAPILLVDDDSAILSAMELLLTDEGYSVMLASNGAEALTQIEALAPCLILLDMRMPVMDGWEFAARYRKSSGPHAPIIVMTAAHDARLRADAIEANDFIAKPFDINQLLMLVSRYVD
ncbi:MAG TPA: response regulator [Ktedonobacterales bacterium]